MVRRGVTAERVLLTMLFYLTALVDIAARSSERGHPLDWRVPIAPMLTFTLGLAVVIAAVRLQPRLARRVPPTFAVTLGLMTYPLYLLHQEIGAAIIAAAMRLGLSYWSAAAAALTIVLGIAWAVAAIFEPTLRRSLSRPLRGPPRAGAAAGSAGRLPPSMPARRSGG
jgi:peptidoglycan/LPS O-acetylase OafA/YrhL